MAHDSGPAAVRHGQRTSGWLTFAGTLAVVIGAFNIIDGLVALFNDDYYLVGDNRIMVFDFTAWGWFWLFLGIIQVAVGAGIVAGKMWARATGVFFAVLAAIGHLAFLQAFPLWSVLTIAMCVLLIYALTAPPAGSRG
ncbi:hypothetical protein E1293_38635 [Actinomadura darangshiensis]|uniref:DUF7144 domain-containing protein n=1 Tax=Actinomadura darangshiensis TaxID=705336 RepID=A0A4R5A5M0_9ACTN|nr:hypothetical protein [Actinomadura darangshiensis]TDD66865.1 hypothetical protein E1293_38635 [Actinomadura darangshiensis]